MKGRGIVACIATGAIVAATEYFYVTHMLDAPDLQMAASMQRISSDEAIIDAGAKLKQQMTTLRERIVRLPGLIVTTNSTLAAAQVQEIVRTIVSSAGGQIRTSQTLPVSIDGRFENIEIVYDLFVPANRVTDLVYQIESRKPYLFFDKVDIQVPQNVQIISQTNRNGPVLAEIHCTISAYRLSGDA